MGLLTDLISGVLARFQPASANALTPPPPPIYFPATSTLVLPPVPTLTYPARGFDCYAGTLTQAQLVAAKAAGYMFVMHYYGGSASKDLTRASAIATSDLGMWCGAVYEVNGNTFSGDQGVIDAQAAFQFAQNVGQPTGSAIYFAVDTGIGAGPAVLAYFASVASILRPAGYKVGAYGPGAVLAATIAAGTVDYDWLGGAMGWPGSRGYQGAALVQGLPHNVPGVTQVDDDIAVRECGLFQVSA